MGEDINGIAIFDTQYSYCYIIAKNQVYFHQEYCRQLSGSGSVQSPWWDVWADLTGAEMKECVSAT